MPVYYLVYILAILGLEVLLVGLIWLWWRALKQQQASFNHAAKDTYEEMTRIIENTTLETEKVMAEALKTAAHLQQTAQRHVEDLEQQTTDLLTKQRQWHEATLTELLGNYQREVGLATHRDMHMVQQLLQQRLGNLDTVIAQDLSQATHEMRDILGQKLEKVESELEAYKTAEVERIARTSHTIVQQVTKDLLGKTLSPADHHQVVKQQLEQALLKQTS